MNLRAYKIKIVNGDYIHNQTLTMLLILFLLISSIKLEYFFLEFGAYPYSSVCNRKMKILVIELLDFKRYIPIECKFEGISNQIQKQFILYD